MRTNKRSIDSNPRRGISRTPKEIRIYKPWTIIGQIVKVLESSTSPMKPSNIFKVLVVNHIVPNNEKGLQSTRKGINILERHRTLYVTENPKDPTKESTIALRPERKYRFKEVE
jgi:hypothetical protein